MFSKKSKYKQLQKTLLMNNKLPKTSHYHIRRKSNITPFSLNLTDSDELSASLFYSNTHSKLIELNKIVNKEDEVPEVTAFMPINDSKKQCRRKDCVDRKFQAIKKLNKSTPNVKMVSPKKVDIVLSQQNDTLQKKREVCIHSARFLSKKSSPQRDLLKEFKLIEEMRKELRSRNFQNSSRASFYVSTGRSEKTVNMHRSSDNPEKTERSNLYVEVKTRISKRYNSMFKKFTEGAREIMKGRDLIQLNHSKMIIQNRK